MKTFFITLLVFLFLISITFADSSGGATPIGMVIAPAATSTQAGGAAAATASQVNISIGEQTIQATTINNKSAFLIQTNATAEAVSTQATQVSITREDAITINPTEAEPIKINDVPLAAQGSGGGAAVPVSSISIAVASGGGANVSIQTKNVQIEKIANGTISINISGVSAQTTETLKVENSKISVVTPIGAKAVNVLPDEVLNKTEIANQTIESLNLVVKNNAPTYEVKAKKQVKILGLIPIDMDITTQISAESGNVTAVIKPWWYFFTR